MSIVIYGSLRQILNKYIEESNCNDTSVILVENPYFLTNFHHIL